ncbi:MAG: hypothetical protein WCK42_04655, partial [Myxococcaceae bacterium]
MPAIPHGAQPDWVNARFQPQRPHTALERFKEFFGFEVDERKKFFIAPPRIPALPPAPPPKTFEEELVTGLQCFGPT